MTGQKKFRLTFFDILFIAIVFAVVVYAGYSLASTAANSKGTAKKLEFSVLVPMSTEDIASLVKTGDTVTLSAKGDVTVKKTQVTPASKLSLDAVAGQYKLSMVPEKVDIIVTAEGSATESDQQITVGKTPVRVGTSISLDGRGYSLTGTVLEMNLSDNEGEVKK